CGLPLRKGKFDSVIKQVGNEVSAITASPSISGPKLTRFPKPGIALQTEVLAVSVLNNSPSNTSFSNREVTQHPCRESRGSPPHGSASETQRAFRAHNQFGGSHSLRPCENRSTLEAPDPFGGSNEDLSR